jgi:hypothetical protein
MNQIMYEDSTVRADDVGITISRYQVTGATKRILYDEIQSATVFDMGVAGRWTIIGVGPTRIRSWYNWDSSRRSKTKAVEIDSGGMLHPTVTPDDTAAFIATISEHVKIR